MNSSRSFQEKSYGQHANHFDEYSRGGQKEGQVRAWLDKDTVDAWLHQRKYQSLDPILRADPNAKWLTVGDGKYGKDAHYLLEKGFDVVASDISDVLLKEAKEDGYISQYRKQNAESLSFLDGAFDYILCKESYHHFPRPMIALYEMLRVAIKGVVLIEPNDAYINTSFIKVFFRNIKRVTKTLLGKKSNKHCFEESGNYVFSISQREIEKVALGLNCCVVAFKGINDAYLTGAEYEKLSERGPLQRKIKGLIKVANILCKLRLMDYGLLVTIIFKQKPPQEILLFLSQEGYQVINLPQNPYISYQ